VPRVLPLLLLQVAVATVVFWLLSFRAETRKDDPNVDAPAAPEFRINYIKAAVPLVPLVLLFLTGPPLQLFEVPKAWLTTTEDVKRFDSRLIGAAMLIGVVAAAAVTPGAVLGVARAFFEGAGYAMTNIISTS
jgi:DcuC family C4-dicarboxylate transporter